VNIQEFHWPKIAFIGSPPFAVASLAALLRAGAPIVAVVCQPDKPAGRGNELRAPAVKEFALAHNLPLLQPVKVRDGALAQWLREQGTELVIVAAYGRILGPDVLYLTPLGCVNVHASLLPRWRGASPITRAIAAGDAKSGVCLMHMDEGMDTGPELARVVVPIADTDTTATLEQTLADAGAELLVQKLPDIVAGRLPAMPQPEAGLTFAPPVQKHEGRIDWTLPARQIHALVRAMQPWPGASTTPPDVPGEVWKVFEDGLALGVHVGEPGTILAVEGKAGGDAIWLACGEGSLRVASLQRPGKRAMPAAEVLRGMRWGPGQRLG
jgi:methionyl-tRNA formyltransferase